MNDLIKLDLVFPKKRHINKRLLVNTSAKICYEPQIPRNKKGQLFVPKNKMLDMKSRLFDVSHHTVFEHILFIFDAENLSVSDITFGLHLVHPFYNSSQRSGRFCANMFAKPDIDKLLDYLKKSLPHEENKLSEYKEFFRRSLGLYNQLLPKATELAKKFIREERPFANEKYIETNALKIAQEQTRVLGPTIFNTAIRYSADLISIASLFATAWTPNQKHITEMMRDEILKQWPYLDFVFDPSLRIQQNSDDFVGILPQGLFDPSGKNNSGFIRYEPISELISVQADNFVPAQTYSDLFPVDLLQFAPKYMDSSTEEVKSYAEISIATMGQDQRHRTIRRGSCSLTGFMYCPPPFKRIRTGSRKSNRRSRSYVEFCNRKRSDRKSCHSSIWSDGALQKKRVTQRSDARTIKTTLFLRTRRNISPKPFINGTGGQRINKSSETTRDKTHIRTTVSQNRKMSGRVSLLWESKRRSLYSETSSIKKQPDIDQHLYSIKKIIHENKKAPVKKRVLFYFVRMELFAIEAS